MGKTILVLFTACFLLQTFPVYAVDVAGKIPHMMTDMHQHMRHMQRVMDQIYTAESDEEYQNLMHEHMQGMNEGMKMMHGMMDKGKMGRGTKDEDGRDKMGMNCEMMSERMNMMQMMMEQMMQHQQAYQFRHRHH